MKKSQVEHVLRAARSITGNDEFYIVGSQSLHGKHPDLADKYLMSFEVDLISKNSPRTTEILEIIGEHSQFHTEFGYYADPVEIETSVLPKDWKNRLVHLKLDDVNSNIRAFCLSPADLAVAKLAAGREKDSVFLGQMIADGIVSVDTIRLRMKKVDVTPAKREQMETFLSVLANRHSPAMVAAASVSAETGKLAQQFNALPAKDSHIGAIVAMSAEEVIQHVGRGKYVVWDATTLSGIDVQLGEIAEIKKAGIVQATILTKDKGLGS